MRKLFVFVLACSVLAEFVVDKHPHFEIERYFGGYALYGFIACAALILISKSVGVILKRPDSYYDE